MAQFGIKDTRFKGAREMPGETDNDRDQAAAETKIRFHNWMDEIFKARMTLSRISTRLQKKNS